MNGTRLVSEHSAAGRGIFQSPPEFPSCDEFINLLNRVIHTLEGENPSYRPRISANRPGGLVDLTESSRVSRNNVPMNAIPGEKAIPGNSIPTRNAVPTLIVPDLHGRWQFFRDLLDFSPDFDSSDFLPDRRNADACPTVRELLAAAQITVVCVGDGLHSELHRERWLEALADYEAGNILGAAMRREMAEGLALMASVMACKAAFPARFHFLKGNHENIVNRWRGGDRPFRKFAREGEMSRRFVEEFYGEEILSLYSHFESLLPLCVAAPRCLVTHAEPLRAFSRREVVESPEDEGGEAAFGLTWTRNDESREGAVAAMLAEFLPEWWRGEQQPFECRYFGGHRTIAESYRLRQGGLFVQIHNPRRQQVALVPVHRPFDPERDILHVAAAQNKNQEEL